MLGNQLRIKWWSPNDEALFVFKSCKCVILTLENENTLVEKEKKHNFQYKKYKDLYISYLYELWAHISNI